MNWKAIARLWAFNALVVLAPSLAVAQAPVGRPVLFVHGWCGNASSWGVLGQNVASYVTSLQPSLYKTLDTYTLYYDPVYDLVREFTTGADYRVVGIPSSARFFYINFNGPNAIQIDSSGNRSVNTASVATVSILNKADELAQVIQAITNLTHVKDVIVVGHSMGGLVTRAYMEGQAIPSQKSCTDQGNYSCQAIAFSQQTNYTQDVAKLITLDTPHGGAEPSALLNVAALVAGPLIDTYQSCATALTAREMAPTSWVLFGLNSSAGLLPSGVPIASVQSFDTLTDTDTLLTQPEQSIGNVAPVSSRYNDIPDGFDPSVTAGCFPPILHLLGCVGEQDMTITTISQQAALLAGAGQTTSISVQATLDGNPYNQFSYILSGPSPKSSPGPTTYYDVAPGTYSLALAGGGPSGATSTILPSLQQVLGSDHSRGVNNWNITFTIAFTSAPEQQATPLTGAASGIDGGSAILSGTVNPNGNTASAYFEYGTSSSLATYLQTPTQPAGSGTSPYPITASVSSLTPNTTYYYRIVAKFLMRPYTA